MTPHGIAATPLPLSLRSATVRISLLCAGLWLTLGCISSSEQRIFTGGTLQITVTGSDVLPSTPLEAPGAPTAADLGDRCRAPSPPEAASSFRTQRSLSWTPLPSEHASMELAACWTALQSWPHSNAELHLETVEGVLDTGAPPGDGHPSYLAALVVFDADATAPTQLRFSLPELTRTPDPRGTYEGLSGQYFPADCDASSCSEVVTVTLGLNFADVTASPVR